MSTVVTCDRCQRATAPAVGYAGWAHFLDGTDYCPACEAATREQRYRELREALAAMRKGESPQEPELPEAFSCPPLRVRRGDEYPEAWIKGKVPEGVCLEDVWVIECSEETHVHPKRLACAIGTDAAWCTDPCGNGVVVVYDNRARALCDAQNDAAHVRGLLREARGEFMHEGYHCMGQYVPCGAGCLACLVDKCLGTT